MEGMDGKCYCLYNGTYSLLREALGGGKGRGKEEGKVREENEVEEKAGSMKHRATKSAAS